MTNLFIAVLNMSITASYVALAVMLIRVLFRKLPKIFSYVLWSAVLIRLAFPFSFTSTFSFLQFLRSGVQASTGEMAYIPSNIGFMQYPAIHFGINVNSTLPPATPQFSVNPMQVILSFSSLIWFIGILVLIMYSGISYLKVLNKIKTATLVKDNIFESDQISTPFVCGLIKPKIYIPTGIKQHELAYILEHEQTHIRRLDYLVKPFAFLLLIIHWFNPIMWLAFVLISKDMEMSCDERVIKKMGSQIKGSYSHSLLSLSVQKSGLLKGSPLAFGESNIKSRIKNILAYKKPTFTAIALAAVITAALVVGFTANPKMVQSIEPTVSSSYNTEALMANKTPYVGNNSKVTALIDALPWDNGIVRESIELHTAASPYGITINFNGMDPSMILDEPLNKNISFKHAALLFSLIDNVDQINYMQTDINAIGDRVYAGISYTRKEIEDRIGSDVRGFAVSEKSLKDLIDRLDNMPHVIK